MCGGNKNTTTTTTAPSPAVVGNLNQAAQQVSAASQLPYVPVTQGTAPVNAQQQTGANTLNAATGLLGSAAQPLTADQIQQYYNPYQQNVINATEAQFANQNAQQQQGVIGNAVSQGAWGGDRSAVAQALTAQQQQLAQAPVIAGLEQQGYTQALGTAAQQYQQNPEAVAAAEGNLGLAQYGVGTQEQQTSQAALNATYAQQLAAAGYPFQAAAFNAGNTASLAGAFGGTSQTTLPPPSLGSSLAGLGTAGIGAGMLLAGKRGGRIQGLQTGGVPYNANAGLYAGPENYVPAPMHGSAGIGLPRPPQQQPQQDGSTQMFQNALKMADGKGTGLLTNTSLGDTVSDTLQDIGDAAGGRVPRAYGGLALPTRNRINVPTRSGFGMPSFMSRGGLADGGTPDDDVVVSPDVTMAPPVVSDAAPAGVQVAQAAPSGVATDASQGITAALAAPATRQPAWKTTANEWANAGMSANGIAGVLANVKDESNFDPTQRHPDQPHWGGEAHYAHGLYQEGGQEWNNYANWLKNTHPGANWQDPQLQSEFTAQNLKTNYPQVWDRMANAKTKEEAAQAFVSGYLKPAAHLENARRSRYAQGVPAVEDYENGTALAWDGTPAPQRGVGTTSSDTGGIPSVTPIKAPDISGKTGANRTDIALSLMAAGLGMMGSRSPYAGVGIGQGGLQGVGTYEALHKQRVGEAESQARLQQSADIHNQTMQMHREQLAETKRAHEANEYKPIPMHGMLGDYVLYPIPGRPGVFRNSETNEIIDSTKGTVTPASPTAGTQNTGQEGLGEKSIKDARVSGKHGQEMLDAIPQSIRPEIAAVANYQSNLPDLFSKLSKLGSGMSQQQAAQLVYDVNPDYSTNYAAASKAALRSFYAGGNQSPAGQIMFMRTAIGHAGEVSDALEEMRKANPTQFQTWAAEAQTAGVPFGSYLLQKAANSTVQGTAFGQALARYETVYPLFANETNRLYVGGPGSQTGRDEIAAPLKEHKSYQELTAALATSTKAIGSRAGALEDRFKDLQDMPGMSEYGTLRVPIVDAKTGQVTGYKNHRDLAAVNGRAQESLSKIEERDRLANPQHYATGTPGGGGATAIPPPEKREKNKVYTNDQGKKATWTGTGWKPVGE